MITHHALMAQSLARELGLPDAAADALGCAYEQWDGKGWPGRPVGRGDPAPRPGSPSSRSSSRWRTGRAGPRRRASSRGGAAAASSTRPSRR